MAEMAVAAAEDDPHHDGLIGCEVFCGDQGSRQDVALGSEVLVVTGDCADGQDEGGESERATDIADALTRDHGMAHCADHTESCAVGVPGAVTIAWR